MSASQFHLSYSSTKNVLAWAKPGVIFVPDQHRDDPVYRQAQAQGAEVSPYLNVCEDHVRGAKDREYREFLAYALASASLSAITSTRGHTYLTATPPVVDPVDNRLAEAQAMREWLHQNAGGEIAVERDALRAERNAALAVVEDLEQQIQILHERALSATNSLDTSVAAIRGAIEQLRGGAPE